MAASSGARVSIGQFLRAKRAALSPEDVGVVATGRFRRVAGLRREEVAWLAGVSTDYYTRLEQDRVRGVSDTVLSAVAGALRLDAAEDRYLRMLAWPPVAAAAPTGSAGAHEPATVSPRTQAVLDGVRELPALVVGSRMDVIGWNDLGSALFPGLSGFEEQRRNLARMVFLEPTIRSLYPDWAEVAHGFVARLRLEAPRHTDDPRFTALIEELATRDRDFHRWWRQQHVRELTSGRKRVRHPVAGELTLEWESLRVNSEPEQSIVVHTAPAGSPTRRGLRRLADWSASLRAPGTPT